MLEEILTPSETGSAHLAPRVAVLMASLNGSRWIREQIDSILAQCEVRVELFVSDDGSTDATPQLLNEIASTDRRVHWSTNPSPKGYAAANFFHMIRTLDLTRFDYTAFADQDDIWLPGKLAQQIGQLTVEGADGASSDVIAYWSSGRSFYFKKSYPQRKYDFIFETPGPGCTMLLTPRLLARMRLLLLDPVSPASRVGYHDWLIYAVARASGWRWHIADKPTILYRQHAYNEVGVNRGVAAAAARLRRYITGNYAKDCRAILAVAIDCAERAGTNMSPLSVKDIFQHGRRRWIQRMLMAVMFPFGIRPAIDGGLGEARHMSSSGRR